MELFAGSSCCNTNTYIDAKNVCNQIGIPHFIYDFKEEFKKYEIRALDFARLCGIDPKNVYRDFRNMIDSIDEKAFWVNLDNRVIKLRWFNEPEYNERKGTISLILDSRIKTYLLGIQNNSRNMSCITSSR